MTLIEREDGSWYAIDAFEKDGYSHSKNVKRWPLVAMLSSLVAAVMESLRAECNR